MTDELPFYVARQRPLHVGLLLAHEARRAQASMLAVERGTGSPVRYGAFAGGNADLLKYYELLVLRARADRLSEDIYQKIAQKRRAAESLMEEIRTGGLDRETIQNHMMAIEILMDQAGELSEALEHLTDE